MSFETIFTIEAASIKFGSGATREVGYDMKELGARRVMVAVDPHLTGSETAAIALESLKSEGIDTVVYDGVRVEPTDVSLKEAIAFATEGKFDGYVAVGGGSTIDTAKVADLYSTYPADFLEYVNAPVGRATPVPGPLKPLVAIPTTAGTGSETTGSPSSTSPRCTPRPGSPTGPFGPGWASSIPITPARFPGWPSPARRWTSSVTPSNRSPHCPSSSAKPRKARVRGPPTREPTPSAASGRPRPPRSAPST